MLNLQRNWIDVNSDARINSRIEFHHPVVILGIDTMARIMDFSVGGFYIKTDQMAKINKGQRLNLALKLPEESAFMTIKALVVHRDEAGFGCKLLNQNDKEQQALAQCFELFSGMLPME